MTPWTFSRLLLLPVMVFITALAGGWWIFATPVICFIIHPLLNLLVKQKAPIDETHLLIQSTRHLFRWVALLYVPVLIGLTSWSVYFVTTVYDPVFLTGFALSVGIINGALGFTLAHEFIHANNNTERTAGYLLLLQNFYMHYGIEHIGGHHVYACTDKDPHTARLGESFYRFLPGAIAKTFLNAVIIEKGRKKNKHPFINRVTLFLALQLILLIIIVCTAGWAAAGFYLIQCFIAIALLHNINYLQHYGLMRKQVIPGKPERITAHHAWNTNNKISAFSLFQLENHADHHMHPSHSYEKLETHDESPQYPTGYSGMMVLTLLPSLWFKITNKKITLQLKTT
ncbi:MAG TPA: alkane 1-monooxygenase [Ferruginibacter sp.]|nr:alkane 1-monooxygenase [Ferruginibacter sp.]